MKATVATICMMLAAQGLLAATTKEPGVLRVALCQTPALETDSEEWTPDFSLQDDEDPNGGEDPNGDEGPDNFPEETVAARIGALFRWVGDRLVGDEDLVILPEYAFTSFSEFPEAGWYAPLLWQMASEFALDREVWLIVNHPNREGGEESALFNETRIYSPEGEAFAVYRKRMLANMDRDAGFSPGTEPVVADLPFGRVGLLICKDTQYPEKGGAGYVTADFLVAQFAHPGVDDPEAPEAEFFPPSDDGMRLVQGCHSNWDFLSVPFLGVNKTGPDGNYTLCGGTRASDRDGTTVVDAGRGAVVLLIEMSLLEDGRVPPPPPFSIRFDPAGGSVSRTAVEVARGTAIGALPAPTRKGFKFLGWHTARSGGSKVSSAIKPSRDMTLFAHWSATAYKVAYNAYGGTLPKGKKMAAQKMTYGKAAKLAKNVFTRKGYVFAGWAMSKVNAKKGAIAFANGAAVKNLSAKGGTVTLYAVWAKPTYKVAFYANGGTGKTAVQAVKYGKAAKLAACKFKAPKGRKFAGWATSEANAKKGVVKFKNKQAVKNLVITGKTIKLYAVWVKK